MERLQSRGAHRVQGTAEAIATTKNLARSERTCVWGPSRSDDSTKRFNPSTSSTLSESCSLNMPSSTGPLPDSTRSSPQLVNRPGGGGSVPCISTSRPAGGNMRVGSVRKTGSYAQEALRNGSALEHGETTGICLGGAPACVGEGLAAGKRRCFGSCGWPEVTDGRMLR